MKKSVVLLAAAALALVAGAGCSLSSYNALVDLDQEARSKWAQVQNVYQRRLDLVPNLVRIVKAAANFERDTLSAVIAARSKAEQAATSGGATSPDEPGRVAKFQQAQDELSSALSRLLVVVEGYPEIKAAQNFRDLQSQLEGTENRISVERKRYSDAARQFNTKRQSFPTSLLVKVFGDRFREKGYFSAESGAENSPNTKF